MRLSFSKFGLPLLARELTELSARRRTYVIRTVYAILLYVAASWAYRNWVGQFRPDSFDMLGNGKPFFLQLVRWQFWGVYLSLPLLTCGAITNEKERQTLQLLRLTKLGGWTILFEKLGSRLVAMGTFLLLPLPLAAVAYSMGGVEVADVVKSVYVLSITAIQIGCFSLLCSAWSRTSTGAMVAAYLLGAAGLFYGSWLLRMVLVGALSIGVHQLPWPGLDDYGREWFEASVTSNDDYQPLSGPWVFGYRQEERINVNLRSMLSPSLLLPSSMGMGVQSGLTWLIDDEETTVSAFGWPSSFEDWLSRLTAADMNAVSVSMPDAVICSIPILISAIVCLLAARFFLWRRADAAEWDVLRALFQVADRWFLRINRNKLTRGLAFGIVGEDLPTDLPIAWRETRRQLIGKTEYLGRMLILIEVPLVGWLVWNAFLSPSGLAPKLSMAWNGLWLTTCLIVTVVSTGLVPWERSRQTLDVILTTPLSASEIVRQKLAGLRRLTIALCVPLLTLLTFRLLVTWHLGHPGEFSFDIEDVTYSDSSEGNNDIGIVFPQLPTSVESVLNRLGQIMAVPVYLSFLGWLGFQFGFRLKNQLRAVLAVAGASVLMFVIPMGLGIVFKTAIPVFSATMRWIPRSCEVICNWFNPIWILHPDGGAVRELELPIMSSDVLPKIWFPLLFHFLFVGGMLWRVRRNAYRQFSRFVHRMEPVLQSHIPIKRIDELPVLEFEAVANVRPSPGCFREEHRSSDV